MRRSIHFYASDDDLLLVLTPLLDKHRVRIYLAGSSQQSSPRPIRPADMRIGTTDADQHLLGDAYLFLPEALPLQAEERTLVSGKTIWLIDQLSNNESVVLRPEGRRLDNVVIAGKVDTDWESEFSTFVLRDFAAGLRKHFVKVQAYWVGPKALAILRNGGRLTHAIQSPRTYDLKE